MKAQSKKLGKFVGMIAIVVAFLTISFNADASYYGYNRNKARKTINKTAYIIEEAYSIADYYGYWTGSNLSRAVYYNDYAEHQYNRRNFRRAIHYSLKARDYALRVIDGCDDYWDYFYYNNYGWSRYYGYNPYYSGNPGYHYGNYNNYYNTYYNTHHNNHGNNSNYNSNRPNTYNDASGRNGRTGAFDPNKPNNDNGGNRYGHLNSGGNFKNINTESYFDNEELSLLKELPAETSMEETFKKDNKGVSFNDNSLRSNSKLINSNRTRAQEFKQSTPEASRAQIKLQEPKRINEVNRTKEENKESRIDDSKKENRVRENNTPVMETRKYENTNQTPNRRIESRENKDKDSKTFTPERNVQQERKTIERKTQENNNSKRTINNNKSNPQPRSSSFRESTPSKKSSESNKTSSNTKTSSSREKKLERKR